MNMRYEFIAGVPKSSRKRAPRWEKLLEIGEMTYCGSPSFYACCDMFKLNVRYKESDSKFDL